MDEKRWKKTRKDEKNITSIRKYSKKVNCWGAIFKGGKCSLKLFTQNMDAEFYVKILTEKFNEMRSMWKKNWELQFDNDPKYKSKLAQEYLKNHKIVTLEWPLYSPDLNPIENIWRIMVWKLRKKNISTQSNLIVLVNQEWEKIDQEQIDNWIDSMSGRIIEWIDHDGDRIKY